MKIALLGAAPSSKDFAPYSDVNWEIWACSPPNYTAPRVDAWFELHSIDRKMQHAANAPYISILQQHPRVYVAARHPAIPNAIPYPKDEVLKEFAPFGNYFMTSSLAWMFAMAIMQKPEMIGLWGVDMSATEEYGYQRAGCHFLISWARKCGIDVYAPPQSDILQPIPLYGFKEQTRMFWKQKARREELMGRLDATISHQERLEKERLIFQGAIDDMNYVDNTWLDDGEDNWPDLGVLKGIKDGENPVGPNTSGPKESGGVAAGDDSERPGV